MLVLFAVYVVGGWFFGFKLAAKLTSVMVDYSMIDKLIASFLELFFKCFFETDFVASVVSVSQRHIY